MRRKCFLRIAKCGLLMVAFIEVSAIAEVKSRPLSIIFLVVEAEKEITFPSKHRERQVKRPAEQFPAGDVQKAAPEEWR